MKTIVYQINFLLIIAALLVGSCTITVEDDNPDSSVVLNEMETFGWVYSEITFNGSGLDASCGNVLVTLSNGTINRNLVIQDCSANAIVAWIPEDMAAGTYDVTLNVNGNTFTSLNDVDLQVEVKIRPVILTQSATEIEDGGTLEVTGLYIVNESGISANDPKVWLMKSGYTNTVSEITVNEDGTAATIIIDEGIDADDYDLLITCVEWSNRLQIAIK